MKMTFKARGDVTGEKWIPKPGDWYVYRGPREYGNQDWSKPCQRARGSMDFIRNAASEVDAAWVDISENGLVGYITNGNIEKFTFKPWHGTITVEE